MKKKSLSLPKASNLDINALESQANTKFNAGQYKEATELYKTLLKHNNKAAWQTSLAQCHLHRALAFANKGMVKEAVVLWENYAQNASQPYEAHDYYISWVLQTNDVAKIKNCLGKLSAIQLDEHYPELARLLGFLIISGKISCVELLPQDSAFMRHLVFVQEALAAYQDNKPENSGLALQKLPFRSAFRDFRTLIKAVLLLPESVSQAQMLLAKIPADSPYHQAGALLLTATQDGATLVKQLVQLPSPQIKIIEAAKNFNKKQIELLDVLTKQKDRLSDKLKFNLAIQYQPLLGQQLAQRYCRCALPSYFAGLKDYVRHFGAINDFESARLQALMAEQNRDFHGAEYYWKQSIAALKTQDETSAYKIALIMRHIAEHQDNPEKTVNWLMDSVDYDPDDRDSYVKILHYFEQQNQQNDTYKSWLEKSLKKFPHDLELLDLAIKAATRNKAFKKAAQYAQALLKIDPVNTAAKHVLFTSHLAHARKLIKTKKFHLVENEIQQAESITLDKRHQTQAQLMRGFFVYSAEDKDRGGQLITEALQKYAGGVFNTHFYAMMEALLLGLPIAPLLKLVPLPANDYVLTEPEIIQLTELVRHYAGDDANHALLHKALGKVKGFIKQFIRQDASEATLLALYQCLLSIKHFELLRTLTKIAQARWQKPIWMYYRVYAEANGIPAKCSDINSYRLEEHLKEAQKQNDLQTVILISKFLEQYFESIRPAELDIFDSIFGDIFDGEEGLLDEVFGHLPDDLYARLNKQALVIIRKKSPEQMIKQLAAKYFDNNLTLLDKMFGDPEAMQALLLFQAADDLGINIGVSAQMIAKAFNDQKKPQKPKPFPFF